MVETTRQKIPMAIVRIPIFFLMLILDVHLMDLGDGMIICGKRSAFYSQTACCLIDSSSELILQTPGKYSSRFQFYK